MNPRTVGSSPRGGKVLSDVTSKLGYLVMADPESKSSKAKKARALGTEILAEEEFFRRLDEGWPK